MLYYTLCNIDFIVAVLIFVFALFSDPDIFVVIYTLVLDTKYYIFLSLKFKIVYYTIINLHYILRCNVFCTIKYI